ncbi:MAG: flagellin [Waltera sp.]
MVVQHNLTAMNSNRMLGLTTASQAKSTEKLSSGYKINRAADDAAGLSISEKMRKQIRGLTQASSNAQDGISTVQTAEGALNEVQDMLQRMNELAVKAANGTQSEDDRSYIQNEIDQLTTEIDRVAETTKFNETYLLKGDRFASKEYSYAYAEFKNDATASVTMSTTPDATTKATLTVAFDKDASSADQNAVANAIKKSGITVKVTKHWDAANNQAADSTASISLNGDAAGIYKVAAVKDDPTKFDITTADGTKVATVTVGGTFDKATAEGDDGQSVTSSAITATASTAATKKGESAKYYDKDGNGIAANALNKYFQTDAQGNITARGDAPTVYDAVGLATTLDDENVTSTQDITGSLKLSLHVGADATSNNQITVKLEAMSAKGLGVNGLKVDGTDDTNAKNAIETIKESIQKVSTRRSALGAVQNRLEHTISNLDNVVENTTSAESQIRDTDMATEMVKYSNNNILAQAGQAMLAQANQSNQGVLSLLQ